jgi:glycine/serine hydroxymethyltransferase
MPIKIDWYAPMGDICTCCDKPIPPRRPSLAAQAAAYKATIKELHEQRKMLLATIAAGQNSLQEKEADLVASRNYVSVLLDELIQCRKTLKLITTESFAFQEVMERRIKNLEEERKNLLAVCSKN